VPLYLSFLLYSAIFHTLSHLNNSIWNMINRLLPALAFLFLFLLPRFAQAQNTTLQILGPFIVCEHGCDTLTSIVNFPSQPGFVYKWLVTGPNGYTATANTANYIICPDAANLPPGSYLFTLTVLTPNGAALTATHEMTILPYQPVQLISSNTAPCNSDSIDLTGACEKVCPKSTVVYSVQATNSTGGTNNFLGWTITGATSWAFNDPPFNTSVTVNWGNPGTGSVKVVKTGPAGSSCNGQDVICVTIIPEPAAKFSTDPVALANTPLQLCKGQTVFFTNNSTGADTFEWSFGDGSAASSEINPQHTYLNAGNYTVTLIVRSNCLCADTTHLNVTVLDAVSPGLDCIGTICPGTTVTYTASNGCTPFAWTVSPNGTVLSGGVPNSDSITVQWNAGPAGVITLSAQPCSGNACPRPAVMQVPIISDNATINGPGRVCPKSVEVYTIEPYGGTDFVWALSGGGVIKSGQGTNRITVNWGSSTNGGQPFWLTVKYSNCYLGCGGQDSLPVFLLSPFVINGPVELCENSTGTFTSKLTLNGSLLVADWTLIAPNGVTVWTSAIGNSSVNVPFTQGGGVYRLQAKPVNSSLTCSIQAEWAISISPLPAKPTGISGETNICPNTTYTYEAQGIAGNNNTRWTVQNGPGAPVTVNGNPINVTWGSIGPRWLEAVQISTDGLGCTSDTLHLDVNQIGNVSISGTSVVCEDGTGTYSILSTKKASIQWQISPASAGAVATGQGTDSVGIFWNEPGGHVVNVSVCGQNATFPVTVIAHPAPTVQYPASICQGGTAAVQTSTPYSTYQWLDATGMVISTLPNPTLSTGSYAVKVTDGTGCAGTTTFTVRESSLPNLTISTPDPTGFCNNAGSVTLTALTTPDLAFTYQWFQNGLPLSGATGGNYTTNQYGNYTVVATNQFGCTATAGPVVLFNYCGGGGGGGGFPGGGGIDCPPGTASITKTGTPACDDFNFQIVPGPSYVAGSAAWTFGQSGAGIAGTATGDLVNFKFPNAGYYVMIVAVQLSSGGTCKLVDSIHVNAVAQFNAAPDCPGLPSGFKDVSTLLPPSVISSWQWDFGEPSSGASNASTLENPTHSYAAGNTYQVTLTVTSGSGCTSSQTQSVVVHGPTALTLNPPTAHCSGDALPFLAMGGSDVTKIDWDFGDPASGTANQSGGSPAFHNFSSPATYTVSATSTNVFGCTGTYNENITVSPNPLAGNITPAAPAAICEGKSITLTAPAGAVSYQWSDSTTTTQSITVSKAGVYSVTMTDANGCTYVPPPVKVGITQSPDVLIKAYIENELGQVIGTAYPALHTCAGEDVHLVTVGGGNYGYNWSGGNGISNDVYFSNSRNNLLTVGTHIFTVTVTDYNTGCTAVTVPFTVDVSPLPSGFSIAASGNCAHPASTITYTGPTPGNWQFVWNTGQTGTTLTAGDGGVYYLRVINEFGCEAKSNPVTILPGPPVSAIPAGCHTRCNPDTICLPSLPGIVSWQWFFNGSPVPGATSQQFVAQQSGTYWASVTDQFGCSGQSDPLSLKLLTGYGNVTGKVWSDVNNNGVIDAGDTLVSGIPILLQQAGATKGSAQSGVNGSFAFTNVLSTQYTVQINPTGLPSNWKIVIGQDNVSLTGCNAQDSAGLLVRYFCQVTSTLNLSACPRDAVPYNGTFIAAGATQVFNFTTPAGCDSVVTVVVKKLTTSTGSLSVKVCPGSFYNFNGTQIFPGQTDNFTLQNYQGCDSILTITVGQLTESTSTLNVKVCPGASYNYFGTDIGVGQTANFTFQNYLGCDSTVTIVVGAYSPTTGSVEAAVCPGSTYTYAGTQLLPGTTSTFTLQNFVGCDSVVTVHVAALQASASSFQAGICPGDTYVYNGAVLNSGDVKSFTLTNAAGCDSVVTVTVFSYAVSADTLAYTVCPGASYDYQGTSIPAGTSQVFHFMGFEGCDSSVTVVISAWPDAVFGLESDKSCPNKQTGSLTISSSSGGTPPFLYSLAGNTYQADPVFDSLPPGNYTIHVKDNNGCVFSKDTTIAAIPPLQVTLANGMLPCDSSGVRMAPVLSDTAGVSFLWSNGAATPLQTIKEPGSIWVEVSNTCEKIHKDARVDWSDLGGSVNLVYVPNVMAPESSNPENAMFRPLFTAGIAVSNYKFEIFDRWGDLMFHTTDQLAAWNGAFKSKDMKPGVYVWYLIAKVSFCGHDFDLKRSGDITIVR
jgi:PKD repeat protein